MDERVKRALQQWPDVPDVYDWLSLTRRGEWRLRDEAITNPNLIGFINRNYGPADNDNGFAFQNGPQRVHVKLEATPWIAHIPDPEHDELILHAHTGVALQDIRMFWLSEDGDLIADALLGPALIRDSDLIWLSRWFRNDKGQTIPDHELASMLEDPGRTGLHLALGSYNVPVSALGKASPADHFGYQPNPRKPQP